MKLTIKNVKITGPSRKVVLGHLQKYADHFSDRTFSEIEITKLCNLAYAINAYDIKGTLIQQREFSSQDMMIGYILGAQAHMSDKCIIKEL